MEKKPRQKWEGIQQVRDKRVDLFLSNVNNFILNSMAIMNILHIQKVSDLKRAFELNLQITEVRDGEILWLGNGKDLNNYLNRQ